MGDNNAMMPPLSKLKRAMLAVASDPDVRVLTRITPQRHYDEAAPGEELLVGAVVDTETTGTNTELDTIIEIAVVPFTYTRDGRVIEVLEERIFTGMQQPSDPLDPEISLITGLTDADLAGQLIDVRALEETVAACSLLVAHNAPFDRPMCERLSAVFRDKPWVCTMNLINWRLEGANGRSLDAAAAAHMLWFSAHRALDDARALLHLVALPLPESARMPLAVMIEELKTPRCEVWLWGAPFEARESIRAAGFRWRPQELAREKGWALTVKDIDAAEAIDRAARLAARHGCRASGLIRVNPKDMFSKRSA